MAFVIKIPVLLVHEDGTIEQQDWSDDLYAGIEAGVVEVIRLFEGQFQYYASDGWRDV